MILIVYLSMKKGLLMLCLLVTTLTISMNNTTTLWPLPKSYSYEDNGSTLLIDPCMINYQIEAGDKVYIN